VRKNPLLIIIFIRMREFIPLTRSKQNIRDCLFPPLLEVHSEVYLYLSSLNISFQTIYDIFKEFLSYRKTRSDLFLNNHIVGMKACSRTGCLGYICTLRNQPRKDSLDRCPYMHTNQGYKTSYSRAAYSQDCFYILQWMPSIWATGIGVRTALV